MAPSFFSESHSQNFQGIPTTVTTQEKLSMGSCKDYHPSLQTAPCGRPAPGLAQSTQGPPLSLRPPLSSNSALPSPPANPNQPPPTFLDNPFFQASCSRGDKCSSSGLGPLARKCSQTSPGSRYSSFPGRALKAGRVRACTSGARPRYGSGSRSPLCASASSSIN